MSQIPVEWCHLVLGDRILEALQRSLLNWFGRGRVGEREDVLGDWEKRIFRILGIGTHRDKRKEGT